MSNKGAQVLVFFAGLTMMALSAVMGKVLQRQLFELGMAGMIPKKLIALGTREFAAGQPKSIMAFFVLGWLFTMPGLFKASRAGRSSA